MKEFSKEEALRGYDIWGKPISKEEGFKLPEKWKVSLKKDNALEFFNGLGRGLTTSEGYITSHPYSWKYPSWGLCITKEYSEDYTEITLELFKKYVLKEGGEPKSLVGRWFKALVNNAQHSCIKKNNYYLITSENDSALYFNVEDLHYVRGLDKKYTKNYELMPEGFEPSKKEVKEDIPEYVECIIDEREKFGNFGKLGRIYKVLNWNQSESDCVLEGTTSSSTAKRRFKPSTKEAYDRQQRDLEIWNSKIKYPLTPKEEFKEKWIPQVGDWIVCIEGGCTHKKGDITRVTFYGNHNGSQKLMTPELDKLYPYKEGWAYASNFRKAEPHEVPNYSEEKWEKVGEVKVKYEFHLEEEKKENKNITLWSAPIVGVEEEKEYIPLAIKKFKKLTLWQK